MTDPIALAVAFFGNLETIFLNILKVFGILFFKIKLKPLVIKFRQEHTRLMGAVPGRMLWGTDLFSYVIAFTNLSWFP